MSIMRRYFIRLIFTTAGLFIFGSTFAQWNVSAGYVYAALRHAATDIIIDDFNASHPNSTGVVYSKQTPHFAHLQGLDIGVRYRFLNHIGITAQYTSIYQNVQNTYQNGTYTDLKDIFTYFQYSYGLGAEVFDGWFGAGASLELNFTSFKHGYSYTKDRQFLLLDHSLSNHYFINIGLPINSALTLNLQPFIQIPFKSLDFLSAEQTLNPDSPRSAPGNDALFTQRVVTYGIKLILSNGRLSSDN